MANRTLEKDELEYLKRFIERRGFRDEGVLADILDHFACKTEELLARDPKLGLQQAAERAHASFGVRGFADLAKAYQDGLEGKYKAVYWHQFRRFLYNPLHELLLFALGSIAYQAYLYAAAQQWFHILDQNDFTFAFLLLIFAGEVLLHRKISSGSRKGLIIQAGLRGRGLLFFLPYWYFMIHKGNGLTLGMLQFHAWIHALALPYTVWHYVTRYQTFAIAKEDLGRFRQLSQ